MVSGNARRGPSTFARSPELTCDAPAKNFSRDQRFFGGSDRDCQTDPRDAPIGRIELVYDELPHFPGQVHLRDRLTARML
jgi:hypothetical protein